MLRLAEYLPASLLAAACAEFDVLREYAFVKELGVVRERESDVEDVVDRSKKALEDSQASRARFLMDVRE